MASARTPDGDVLVTGLPMTAVDSMLTRLVVVEAAVTLAGGSGLGLAIVSAVTAAHDGRVEVRSEPGDTVFTLSLPRK
jgi:nitrogen-specific signal transduction histidine kinase